MLDTLKSVQPHWKHPWSDSAPQNVTLWPDLTPREQLEMMGQCYKIAPEILSERIDQTLQKLQLQSLQHRQAGTLSGGMQQRVNVALALIHDPSVVILDEPMQGLDPESRRLMRQLIRDMADTRRAVVMVSTHDIDEAEQMADRVAIMHEGRLLASETKAAIKSAERIGGRGSHSHSHRGPPRCAPQKPAESTAFIATWSKTPCAFGQPKPSPQPGGSWKPPKP